MKQELYFDIHKFQYAKNWNELSKDQLLACIRIIHSAKDPVTKVEQLSGILCNIQPHQHLIIVLDDADEITKFLFDPQSQLTINRFPYFRLGILSKLYGPSDRLNNSSFGEFMMADSFCMNYIESQNPEWLHKLIACLYRPKKRKYNPASINFDGDIREKFNSNNLDSRLKQISKLDTEVKHAILAFFLGCKNAYATTYKHLFTQGSSKGKSSQSPWLEALSSYAKGVGNFNEVLDSNAGLVLFDLDKAIKEGKKMQEAFEKVK